MPEMIQCTRCQRELQIPEELIGRPVKCPSCGLNFITTPGVAAPPPVLPEVVSPPAAAEVAVPPSTPYGAAPATPIARPVEYYPPPPPPAGADVKAARRAVMAPAIILLILAPLWMVCDCVQIHQALTLKFDDAVKALELFPPGEFRDKMEEELERETQPDVVQRTVIMKAIFAVTSLLVFVGAAQMLRLRSWILALAAGVLTVLHFDHCCCVPFNMAAGIYALIVLFLPWVRSAFP